MLKGDSSPQERWKWVLTVIFTETLQGGKAVSKVIERFTVQKTIVSKLRAKGILTPYVESCSSQSLFEEQSCLFPSCWLFPPAVWCTKSDLYVISAAMLNTIAHCHNLRNHLIEMLNTPTHPLIVATLFLALCSPFSASLGPKVGHVSLVGVGGLWRDVSIWCTSQVVISFWWLTQLWWLLPPLESTRSHFYMFARTFSLPVCNSVLQSH